MYLQRTFVLLSALALLATCAREGADEPSSTSSDGGAGGADDGTGGGANSAGTGGGTSLIDAPFEGGGDPLERTNKVDLLFVIDNSISMADKQQILADTIPDLIERMATPDCVTRGAGDEVVERFGPSTIDGECPQGGELEFRPVSDIHVGMISSSLGGHGSTEFCHGFAIDYDPSQEDMARLLTRSATGGTVPTLDDLGFLAWDPEGRYSSGDTDLAGLQSRFADLVRGVGEQGCGFEAQLESAYRFLIEPEPYESLTMDSGRNPPLAVPTGTDTVLLEQRANFLRPDSLLAIFTITDENDCSVRDEFTQYYWMVLNAPMARATSHCTGDPNDPCCTSCALDEYPDGCSETGAPQDDSECQKGTFYAYPGLNDHLNVRCFDQQRRFGVDFLWPIQRYINGIESDRVPDRAGELVPNPIYSDLQCEANGTECLPARARSFVFWVGIVGVPWQDVAVNAADLKEGLLPGPELDWDLIVGDPENGVAPTDPHMIESIAPRSGTNPRTGDQILPPDTTEWNPINGHERNIPDRSDLQYACIFPLPASRVCSSDEQKNCDCRPESDPVGTSNPLCQAGAGDTPGSEQFYAKAYPSIRVLQVLKGLDDPNQVVVSSICPANMTDDQATDYGYRPVVPPLMDRIVTVLLPR